MNLHKGFIQEEGRKSWKGDKTLYSLTEKGREEYIRIAFDNLNKALKDVKDINDSMRSDPKKLKNGQK